LEHINKKIMRYIILTITILVLFSSCLTQKRAAKKLNQIAIQYPELITEKSDTLIDIWEITKEVIIEADTTELFAKWNDLKTDSIVYEIVDSIYMTEVKLIRDTFINVSIKTEVFADTIFLTVRDTIDRVINNKEFVTKIENKIPWWIWFILFVLSLCTLILLIHKK